MSEWIPVDENPPKAGPYLVADIFYGRQVANYRAGEWKYLITNPAPKSPSITHWMPLPKFTRSDANL